MVIEGENFQVEFFHREKRFMIIKFIFRKLMNNQNIILKILPLLNFFSN